MMHPPDMKDFLMASNFLVNKGNMGNELMPVISSWANGWHGLDAVSYTHLDVYSVMIIILYTELLCRSGYKIIIITLYILYYGKEENDSYYSGCLLYTSRCV